MRIIVIGLLLLFFLLAVLCVVAWVMQQRLSIEQRKLLQLRYRQHPELIAAHPLVLLSSCSFGVVLFALVLWFNH